MSDKPTTADIRKNWNTAERCRIKHSWPVPINHDIMGILLERLEMAEIMIPIPMQEWHDRTIKAEALIQDIGELPRHCISVEDGFSTMELSPDSVSGWIEESELQAKLKEQR